MSVIVVNMHVDVLEIYWCDLLFLCAGIKKISSNKYTDIKYQNYFSSRQNITAWNKDIYVNDVLTL